MTIVMEVVGGVTRFAVDEKKFFEFEDPEPLQAGRFGFCTVNSYLWIDGFRRVPGCAIKRGGSAPPNFIVTEGIGACHRYRGSAPASFMGPQQ